MSAKKITYHPCIVPAMDILISDPDILNPSIDDKKKADYLYIPTQYVDRLDDFYHEKTSRGDSAKQLISRIGAMLEYLNQTGKDSFICDNGMRVVFKNENIPSSSSRQNAIMLAQSLKRDARNKGSVAIMTGSDRMIAKAAAAHVDIAHVNPETYAGRRLVQLPLDAVSLWERNKRITAKEWREIFSDEPPLRANEFVELKYSYTGRSNNGFGNIGRFDINAEPGGALVPLKYLNFYSPSYRRIRPITPLQAMYLEALLAPVDEIPIVVLSGVFGIGKTFLPIAVGLNGVGYRASDTNLNFRRIFVCPRDSTLGREIGYVSGDTTEKTLVKALPIIDNVYDVISLLDHETIPTFDSDTLEIYDSESKKTNRKKKRKKDRKTDQKYLEPTRSFFGSSEVSRILEKYFEFRPVIQMGGRSISNSLIIYDEFQDVERFQARELVTRIANGSKMVITGDPTQLSNPHLNRTSNGLNYVASKLADQPFAAILSSYRQEEIIRHWVLREIAKAFGTRH